MPRVSNHKAIVPATSLLLTHLERRLLAGRHGFFRHRQQHRDHDVIARHRGQIHDLLIVEHFLGPRVGFVGDLFVVVSSVTKS